ncbi:hypothetical protein BCR39DRAFT_555374 [Naematelia encephala]|uniref:Phosducin thioredoxin-like domain-containing protein n=1 Tax=Naematelia encephala TaxID=71784 RepID=A0A1Y2AEK0_9TREE|nr:hypothetical protein BCR39DRAFT_555374 [Naematelia encephala]
MSNLEQSALDGSLFRALTHSPGRSPSPSTPSPINTDDELELSPSPSASHGGGTSPTVISQGQQQGAQTGPKGVISDRRAHASAIVQERKRRVRQVVKEQERKGIVAKTVHEESDDQERLIAQSEHTEQGVRAWREQRRRELEGMGSVAGELSGQKGGLREVGKEGFVAAVERPGWVVVLIYEPEIPRCQPLLTSLLHLALTFPTPSSYSTSTSNTNLSPPILLRARATNLAFSLLPKSARDDDDEPEPDPDVLPTLLAYRDGELEKTWIRVDWEIGQDGVYGLLTREGIIPQNISHLLSNSDDDDE